MGKKRMLGALLWPPHLYQHTHNTHKHTHTQHMHIPHTYSTHIYHTYTHKDVVWWCVPIYNPSTWKVEDRGLGRSSKSPPPHNEFKTS